MTIVLGSLSPEEGKLARLIIDTLNLELDPGDLRPETPLYRDGMGLDSIDVLEVALAVLAAIFNVRKRTLLEVRELLAVNVTPKYRRLHEGLCLRDFYRVIEGHQLEIQPVFWLLHMPSAKRQSIRRL